MEEKEKTLKVSASLSEEDDRAEGADSRRKFREKMRGADPLPAYKQGWEIAQQTPKLWENLVAEYRRNNPDTKPEFTERDFHAFVDGVAAVLAEQSNAYGNTDIYSGIKREMGKDMAILREEETERKAGEKRARKKLVREVGMDYSGNIVVTLSGLAKKTFGEKGNTPENRARLRVLIEALDKTFIPFPKYFEEGKKPYFGRLLAIMGYAKDKFRFKNKDGVKEEIELASQYEIALNSIFRAGIEFSYIRKPIKFIDGYLAAVKRDTPLKMMLSRLLLKNRKTGKKNNSFPVAVASLMKGFRLEEKWRKDRKRIDCELLEACEEFKDLGLLTGFRIIRTQNGKHIERIIFFINSEYGGDNLDIPEEQEADVI